MRRRLCELRSDERAAVAPTVALSLFALVGVGGIAFDYARVASLDTEMQNAADQAALAAATQLDQATGAIARATAAANGLLTNQTLMANDNNAANMTVTTATVLFYATKAAAEADNGTNCPTTGAIDPTATGADAAAKFVCVRTSNRVARYALTPIVAAFSSGNISAMAVAGLGSAICKVPPVMMCNPAESTDPNFTTSYVGKGLRLVSVGNGNTAWAPGDFGYLNVNSDNGNPNLELRQALGWTTPPGDCSGLDGVQTRTGAGTSVTPALNTRFDIYEKVTGGASADSCPGGSSCPPSINTIKDVVRRNDPSSDNKCGVPKNNEWEWPDKKYLPTDPSADLDLSVAANVPDAMGHPRDKCHAVSINGSCSGGNIGDGAWDRNAYFKVNYNWTAAQWQAAVATGFSPITTTAPTRYQVYQWEIANRGAVIGGNTILGNSSYGSGGSARTRYSQPVCSQLQGYGSGVVPGGTNVDRRRISAAVLNCTALNVHGGGTTVYPVIKWIELFLVEPSIQRDRTDANDVYVEVIGVTQSGAGSTAGQVVRRDVPYLVK
jgi:Flp pilus assembly protein TadG